MGGGLMQLVAYGAQNVYLNSNPQMTFFKVVFKRHTNFSIESIEQNFSGVTDFGRKISCTISRKGDLLSQIFIEFNLSLTTQDIPRIGHQLIDWIELEIGGRLIDKHYGEWMDIWAQLTHDNSSWNRLDEMISAKLPVLDDIGTQKVYIPLQFWFCRNPGLALPLLALQSQEVKLHVQLHNREVIRNKYGVHLRDVDKIDKVSLFCDYIFLDRDERRRFTQASHEYLIEQVQFSNKISLCGNLAEVELNFNHPVKEIIWALNKKVVSVFQTTGGTGNDAIYGIKPTSDGGSIVTGKFYNTVIFGSTTLTSLGDSDIFVAKIDKFGNWIWAVQAGGGLADGAPVLDITEDNGAMITGYFTGTVYFGQYSLTGDTPDVFVAKISKNGLWQWATSAVGVGASDVALSLTINADGTAIVSGAFRSENAIFGQTTLVNYYPGNESLFVAKISQFGYWMWANTAKGIAYALGTSKCNEGIYVSGGCASSKIEFTESIKINSNDNFVIPSNSNTPQWKWLTNANANISDNLTEPMGICVNPDGSGSIFIATYFKGTNISFNTQTLTSANGGLDESVLIGKLDANGEWEWVYTDPSMNSVISRGKNIAVDASNNLYVTGYTQLDLSSNPIAFVNKYNINGTTLDIEWTTILDTSSNPFGIVVNEDGVYISGWYKDLSSIIPMSNIGDESFFVAKLDIYGSWVWARKIEAGTIGNGLAITDSSGIIYVSGYYDISCNIYDSSGIYANLPQVSVFGDIFIGKINSSGDWLWIRSASSNKSDLPIGLSSDVLGNVYITGYCKDMCYFNGQSSTEINITAVGENDIFIAKLDTSGVWNWVQTAGGPDFNSNNSLRIVCDQQGDVYISGFHEGTCNFYIDNIDIDIYTSTVAINNSDLFTAKIDTSGNWKWTGTAGGGVDYQTNNILGMSIDNSSGSLSVIGYFYSDEIQFGDTIYPRLSSSPYADLFIAQFDGPPDSPIDPIQPTFESSRMYIAKLSNDGQWLWAIGVQGHINIYKVVCMKDGVAVAGTVQNGNVSFGSSVIYVSPIAPESVMTFVAKLSHDGQWKWAIQPETEFSTYPYDMIATLDNGLLLTGSYQNYISFGGNFIEDNLTNIYVAKISSDASWVWVTSSGPELSDTRLSLSTLSDGYFLLAGGITGDGVHFGMHLMGDTGTFADIFIAKLSPNGEWITSTYNNMYTSSETPMLNYWGDDGTDLVNKAVIKLNGQDRFQERDGTYFRCVQPYQHHQNSQQDPDKFLGGFYMYSFALNPEEHQPSGSCNFSRIDNKVMYLKLSDNVKSIKVWALNYNVLRIMSGMAGLAYTN
jgi:hypothetical protein